MSKLEIGATVAVIWPDDPFHKKRPGIIVAISLDAHGPLYRIVYGTTKRTDFGLSTFKSGNVVVNIDEARRLGLAAETRFDLARLRFFPPEAIEVRGTIDAVPDLALKLVEARKHVARPRKNAR